MKSILFNISIVLHLYNYHRFVRSLFYGLNDKKGPQCILLVMDSKLRNFKY